MNAHALAENVVPLRADDPINRLVHLLAEADESEIAPGTPVGREARALLTEAIRNRTLDLKWLPIATLVGLDGREVGAALADAYRTYAEEGYPPTDLVAAEFSRQIGLSPFDPLRRSAEAIGAAGVGFDANPYHNAPHTVEVATNVMVLAQLLPSHGAVDLDADDMADLLNASLGHDLGHDGTRNDGIRFKLERVAAEIARSRMEAAGADPKRIEAVVTLIHATDEFYRSKVRAAAAAAEAGLPIDVDLPPELALLKTDPKLAVKAGLLSDADILCSSGLTVDWNREQTERLGREWKKTLGVKDSAYFFEHVVGDRFATSAANLFRPNLARIRAAALGETPKLAPDLDLVPAAALTERAEARFGDTVALMRSAGRSLVGIKARGDGGCSLEWDDGIVSRLGGDGTLVHVGVKGQVTDPSPEIAAVTRPDGSMVSYLDGRRIGDFRPRPAMDESRVARLGA